jgi:hypothetical protein
MPNWAWRVADPAGSRLVRHGIVALWLCAAAAAQAAGGLLDAETIGIDSCAGGVAMTMAAGDSRALLDDVDRGGVVAAMLARYPVLGENGFTPKQMLLWQKKPGDWLYVALGEVAGRPGLPCSIASFAAARFDFTPSLVQKYFFGKAAPT